MAKVRARPETGTLYLDFFYQGVRCREQTALTDTVENRHRVQALMNRIDKEIGRGRSSTPPRFRTAPEPCGSRRVRWPASRRLRVRRRADRRRPSRHRTSRCRRRRSPCRPSPRSRSRGAPRWRRSGARRIAAASMPSSRPICCRRSGLARWHRSTRRRCWPSAPGWLRGPAGPEIDCRRPRSTRSWACCARSSARPASDSACPMPSAASAASRRDDWTCSRSLSSKSRRSARRSARISATTSPCVSSPACAPARSMA